MTLTRSTLTLLAAAAIAGCATLPVPDRPTPEQPILEAPATYMALGTEPFWNLEVTPARLNFNRPDAAHIFVANPGWRMVSGARVIRSARMTVTVLPGPCSDGMSERAYADRVTVVVDGTMYRGCGGGEMPTPAASLERSGWRITAVNGQPAVAGVEADLNFAEGRMSGTAGCNRLSGSFAQERDRLSCGGIIATRMACMGPRGEQENRVLAILRQPLTIRFGERMTMTWTAPDGSNIALRRLDWD